MVGMVELEFSIEYTKVDLLKNKLLVPFIINISNIKTLFKTTF